MIALIPLAPYIIVAILFVGVIIWHYWVLKCEHNQAEGPHIFTGFFDENNNDKKDQEDQEK